MGITEHSCELCGLKSKSGIEIFGYKGVELSIQSIIAQHFSIQITKSDADDESKIVCKKCWKITDAFHQLYCLVKDVITGFEYNKKSSIQLPPIQQEEKKNSNLIEELDFISLSVKLEGIDYDNDNLHTTSPESKLDIKEENLQQKFEIDDIEVERPASPFVSVAENSDEQTKQLTAKQLQIIEQDKEIHLSLAIVCELCYTTCSTFTELREHYKKKHKIAGYIRCCGRKYKYRLELYEHLRDHKIPVQLRQCSICDKIFSNSTKLKTHMKRHDPTFKKIKCLKCAKLFSTKAYLKIHIEWMHSNRPKSFVCDICGKNFNSKFGIKSHLLAVHEKKNSRICDMCGKLFRSKQLLDGHYKIEHLGIRLPKVQCNICGRWLAYKNILQHLRNHYVNEETCEICGKKAPNRNALCSHMKKVHSGNIFSCTMCTKKFKRQKYLTEHFSTHTGFSLYKCKYCPKEFNYESSLYKHRKDMHSFEVEEDVRQNLFTPFTPLKKINV